MFVFLPIIPEKIVDRVDRLKRDFWGELIGQTPDQRLIGFNRVFFQTVVSMLRITVFLSQHLQ